MCDAWDVPNIHQKRHAKKTCTHQKRPINIQRDHYKSKEPIIHQKSPIYIKRDINIEGDPRRWCMCKCSSVRRDLHIWKETYTYQAKETYKRLWNCCARCGAQTLEETKKIRQKRPVNIKRDLQKKPMNVALMYALQCTNVGRDLHKSKETNIQQKRPTKETYKRNPQTWRWCTRCSAQITEETYIH